MTATDLARIDRHLYYRSDSPSVVEPRRADIGPRCLFDKAEKGGLRKDEYWS